jgi:hypothetical protein
MTSTAQDVDCHARLIHGIVIFINELQNIMFLDDRLLLLPRGTVGSELWVHNKPDDVFPLLDHHERAGMYITETVKDKGFILVKAREFENIGIENQLVENKTAIAVRVGYEYFVREFIMLRLRGLVNIHIAEAASVSAGNYHVYRNPDPQYMTIYLSKNILEGHAIRIPAPFDKKLLIMQTNSSEGNIFLGTDIPDPFDKKMLISQDNSSIGNILISTE